VGVRVRVRCWVRAGGTGDGLVVVVVVVVVGTVAPVDVIIVVVIVVVVVVAVVAPVASRRWSASEVREAAPMHATRAEYVCSQP
jgi:hypothetical protein